MGTYNVHAGHSLLCRGASGILDEVAEDRKVKDVIVAGLAAAGHTVYDCTDDVSKEKYQNLSTIVKKCNEHQVDLDLAIHLNAARNDYIGDGKTGGVEVWGYDANTASVGNSICESISNALGVTNRGFKINPEFYVLKNTDAQALIIECSFVDDKDDADHWNPEICGDAILEALGVNAEPAPEPIPEPAPEPAPEPIPEPAPVFMPYLVKVTATSLNIRSGPDMSHDVTSVIHDRGVYTIVDENDGWGKLKSGAGWIFLSYTKRV